MNFKSKEIQAGALIILLHVVGVIGYSIDELRQYFILLTPYNLLITGVTLIYFHVKQGLGKWYLLPIVYLIGWFAEWLGVEYGVLFGEYQYGDALGYKVLSIPLIIGVNWLVLGYAFGAVSQYLFSSRVLIILFASLGMVLLDLLIEPIAIRYDYWLWHDKLIPMRNYVGWFFVSLIVQYLLSLVNLKKNFKLSLAILGAQILFFALLNLFNNF